MRLTLHIDFDYDGIDESTESEIFEYLNIALESGAEATNSEIKLHYVADHQRGTL